MVIIVVVGVVVISVLVEVLFVIYLVLCMQGQKRISQPKNNGDMYL